MHVRPALARDLPDLATISTKAFFNDDIAEFLAPYRKEHPECFRQGTLRRAKKRFYDGTFVLAGVSDENDPWWDGEESVVAYLSAYSTLKKREDASPPWFSWNALELQLLRLEELFQWYTLADRSMSRSAYRHWCASITGRGPLEDIKKYWEVVHLSVDPLFHNKGIGKMMMRHMQQVAQEDNVPIVVVASQHGKFLYQKLGFINRGAMGAGHFGDAMVWYPPNVPESGPSLQSADEATADELVV